MAEYRYNFRATSNKEEFLKVRQDHPNLPRFLLIKADLVRRGVTFTEKVMEIVRKSDSDVALTACILFQQHKDNQVELFPLAFWLNDGTIVLTCVASEDYNPYVIDMIDGKFYALFDDGEPIAQVRFCKKGKYYDKTTSSGELMQFVGFAVGDTILFCPYLHCHFWNDGNQCVFCDMDYNTALQKKIGRGFKTKKTFEDIYETTKEALKERGRYRHFFMTGGSDPRENFSREFEYQLELVKAVTRAGKEVGMDRVPFYLIASPFTKEQMIQLKEAGLGAYGIYFEIWDREKFKIQCPGKEKYLGYNTFLERILQAVEVFGVGNISAGFVPGIEMAPEPYGFGNDIDRAVNSTLEGYEFLMGNGISIAGSNWTVEPGTVLHKIGATPPPLEFYARLEEGRMKLLQKYKILAKHMCWKHQAYGLYADCQRYI